MKFIFYMQTNIKVLQVDFNTLGIRVSCKVILSLLIGIIKHFKVLKVKSLQYLSKKNLGMEFIFCMKINISFFKLELSFLMEVARHVQRNQNRNLVRFLQHLREKSFTIAFVFYSDAKHSDILQALSHVCCTCFFKMQTCPYFLE